LTCQRRGIGVASFTLGAALCAAACAGLPPALAAPGVMSSAAPDAMSRAAPGAMNPAAARSTLAAASAGARRAATGAARVAPSSAAPAMPPATSPGPSLPPLPLNRDQVLAHVRQTLDWYRETQSLEQVPQLSADVVERDRLQQTALAVVRLGFDFGRAAAAQLAAGSAAAKQSEVPGTGGASAPQPQRSLDQASARVASRISDIESQLTALSARLARAPARARAALRAQRDQLAAALALEHEVQMTIAELQRFQSSMLALQRTGSKDLLGQIAALERTVPEARESVSGGRGSLGGAAGAEPGATGSAGGSGGAASSSAPGAGQPAGARSGGVAGAGSAASTSAAASAAATFHAESAGIIALVGQWIALHSADSQLDGVLKSTDALSKELEALRAPLVAQARMLVRSDTNGVDSADPAQLEASRRALEAATARFRQLSALLVPIADQDFVLDSAHAVLTQWRGALRGRLGTSGRYLLMRVVILATLIVAVLIVSEAWRRAVFKYLHDSRRRSQFQTLRRVVIGIALAAVILFALVSQLGSLATYVGFLTAGLAVALQNVILSIVAYFFLIGRYGVRVGDRITLAGVTGRVVDIGLIRIYLMELGGADLHSTGRIVVLSNSVLFQPQALFKQIPGADYLWHTISLTLAPSVEVQAAQQRLKDAAGEVYEHYRQAIEAQHAAVRRLVDFDTSVPSPEVRVHFAERGWQFDIRYPVDADQAARIDQRMLKAVRAAVAGDEHLPLAESGEPVLKVAAEA